MKKTAVVVFARLPQRGKVKTRLAASLGTAEALALHTACLQSTARLAASFPASIEKRLYFTGPPAAARRAARRLGLPESLTINTQRGETLGERLSNALSGLLAEGCQRVVFLGSDSPTLPRERIQRALRALEKHDAVIGPARDGGYYLIGARGLWPEMFRGIAWGTDRAFRQTVERLRRARRRIALLPAWYDVDRLEDLDTLARDVRRSRARHLSPVRNWLRRRGAHR